MFDYRSLFLEPRLSVKINSLKNISLCKLEIARDWYRMDGVHVSYCECHGIHYMITTDKILLNAIKQSDVKINVINPINFVMEVFE